MTEWLVRGGILCWKSYINQYDRWMNRSLSALVLLCVYPKAHRILHSLREFVRFELPSAMLPCHPNLSWSVAWFCCRWTGFFLDTSPVRAPVVEGIESSLGSLILCLFFQRLPCVSTCDLELDSWLPAGKWLKGRLYVPLQLHEVTRSPHRW